MIKLRFGALAVTLCGVTIGSILWASLGDVIDAETASIDYSDPQRYMEKGADWNNPAYDPSTYGVDEEAIDQVRDYAFDRVDFVEESLEGVPRRKILERLFERITAGSVSDAERHERVAYFLQRASYHNDKWQPLHRGGGMVVDPLMLLELGEMRCGQIARVAVDLFAAGGYEARLVQLGGHVIAEVYYDESWHYLDADLFGGGYTVWLDGKIPSVAELSRSPEFLDVLPAYHEGNIAASGSYYPSYFYFGRAAYKNYGPMYYYKEADRDDELNERYGWNHYSTVKDVDFHLDEIPMRRQPGAPTNLHVDAQEKRVRLTWSPSLDSDGDLMGYRVYVGSRSRHWVYGEEWEAYMYDVRFRLPPADVGIFETSNNFIILDTSEYPLYITIMPYDAYGESIGKVLYHQSEEVRIDPKASGFSSAG